MVNDQRSIGVSPGDPVVGRPLPVVRFFAYFFSVLFHPLFIPLYVVGFLISFHPSFFSGFGDFEKKSLLFTTILNTLLFPLLSVLLMKGLGFIRSVFLHTQQDRIAPYLSAMIFYFWAAWVYFKFEPQLSPVLSSFMTGVVISSVVALLANIYFKISMHAIGCGGMIGLMIVVLNTNPSSPFTLPLMIAIVITGLVSTARLIVSDHKQGDIYMGFFCGFFCQFVSAAFIL